MEELNMIASLTANLRVLEFKLQRIKDHLEARLQVADGVTAVELKRILQMISEFEIVPAGWQLSKPLVSEKYYEEAVKEANDNGKR